MGVQVDEVIIIRAIVALEEGQSSNHMLAFFAYGVWIIICNSSGDCHQSHRRRLKKGRAVFGSYAGILCLRSEDIISAIVVA